MEKINVIKSVKDLNYKLETSFKEAKKDEDMLLKIKMY